MILVRLVLPLLLALSSKAGATGAGVTGSGLSLAVADGAVPVPDGMPLWLAALFAGVGPAVVWLFTRLVASLAAFAVARRDNNRRRVIDMLAVPLAERETDSGRVIRAMLDEADDADAYAKALDAWRGPSTNGGAK